MNTRMLIIAVGTAITSPTLAIAGPIYSTDFQTAESDPAAVWSHSLRSYLPDPYTTVLGRFGNQSVDLTLHATEANTAGLGNGDSGSGPDEMPFNLTVGQIRYERMRVPVPDSGGVGGDNHGNNGNSNPPPPSHIINLGDMLSGSGGNSEPPSTGPRFNAGVYALTFDLMIFDSWDANYEGYGPDKFSVAVNDEILFDEFFEVHHLPNNFRMPDELPEINVFHQSWQDQIYRDISIQFETTEALDRFEFSFIGTLDQGIHDESWGLDNVRVESMGLLRGASAPIIPTPGSLALLGIGGLAVLGRRRR